MHESLFTNVDGTVSKDMTQDCVCKKGAGEMMLSYFDKDELNRVKLAYDIVAFGQGELGLDYMDIVQYMQGREFSAECINSCFSTYAGKALKVA